MGAAFICPNCGAPLLVGRGQAVAQCGYCGSSVAVPQPETPAQKAERSAYHRDPLVPDPTLSEVAALFREGKRVQATILYREITGATLKQAQQALDRLAAGEPLRRPPAGIP
jgi:uncharacterized Zn finger protein (UPF0148 family)